MAKLMVKDNKLIVKVNELATNQGDCTTECCGCACNDTPTSVSMALPADLITCIERECTCTLSSPYTLSADASCPDPDSGSAGLYSFSDVDDCSINAGITYFSGATGGSGSDCCYVLHIDSCTTVGDWCSPTLLGTYTYDTGNSMGCSAGELDDITVT